MTDPPVAAALESLERALAERRVDSEAIESLLALEFFEFVESWGGLE